MPYNRVEMTDAEETLFFERIMQELELKELARKLTDGELAQALIREAWAHVDLWTPAGVLIDEAITRLRRYDIQRRWDERKAKRRAKACFLCGATSDTERWSTCICGEGGSADTDPDADLSEGSAEIL